MNGSGGGGSEKPLGVKLTNTWNVIWSTHESNVMLGIVTCNMSLQVLKYSLNTAA